MLSSLKKAGPVRTDAAGSSIHFAAKRHFAGVRLLRQSMRIGFILAREEKSRRIHKRQKLWGQKYEHVASITSGSQIDAQLLSWLKEAYLLGEER